MIESEWLTDFGPLCAECIAKGERPLLFCVEGGSLHRLWDTAGCDRVIRKEPVCIDCGYREGDGEASAQEWYRLSLMRLRATMEARAAAIASLKEDIGCLKEHPTRWATELHIQRLQDDLEWCVVRATELSETFTALRALRSDDSDSDLEN